MIRAPADRAVSHACAYLETVGERHVGATRMFVMSPISAVVEQIVAESAAAIISALGSAGLWDRRRADC